MRVLKVCLLVKEMEIFIQEEKKKISGIRYQNKIYFVQLYLVEVGLIIKKRLEINFNFDIKKYGFNC